MELLQSPFVQIAELIRRIRETTKVLTQEFYKIKWTIVVAKKNKKMWLGIKEEGFVKYVNCLPDSTEFGILD